MASGSKTSNVFTETNMGDGPSTMQKRSSLPGGDSDLVAYGQDNVHGVKLSDTMGGKMRGSVTNLSHSLEGASAVQRSKGKPENSGI